MEKCGELWDFVRLSGYMHRTFIGYAAALVVVVLSAFEWGQWAETAAAVGTMVGVAWMGLMIGVIIGVPFSLAITSKKWKMFMEEERKLSEGEELNPEKIDEIESTVERKGWPFTATITFVVMLFISDLKKSWKLRAVNRIVTIGLTLIGSTALILTGNVVFAVVWFVYHVSVDFVLFRAVEKVRWVEDTSTV